MKPLRVAVIGVGHLGRIHARRVRETEGLSLTALVEPHDGSRAQVAELFGVPTYAHHREIISQADVAIIASPTLSHHAVASELLSAGLHLFVEKPLAPTTRQASELARLAQRQGCILQVGHVERFNPAWEAAAPWLRRPKYIEAVRRSGFSFRSTDVGVVLDLMIHDIDLVLSLVRSPVRKIEALGSAVFGEHEDIAHARLTFANGCVASLSASRASHRPQRTMQVWSHEAEVHLDFATRSVEVIEPSETLRTRQFDPRELTETQRGYLKDHLLQEHLPVRQLTVTDHDAITAELTDFVRSVRAGRQPRVCGHQGRDAVAVANAILAKIATHAWDGSPDGPIGPQASPTGHSIPSPHWNVLRSGTSASDSDTQRRRSG